MAQSLSDALRLVFIVDAETAKDGDRLDAALGGGASSIWLREPAADGATLYRLARDLRVRCEAHDASLLVGGRADVALAVGAHGVQIGYRSPPARRIRPFYDGWLGLSCHSEKDLARAKSAGADYAVLSPVFGVPEKGPPLGTAAFAALVEGADPLPVVALGGIDTETAPGVLAGGAAGVAVIRALRDAPDPAAAAARLAAG